MRETYFGPLIQVVETRIIVQQAKKWDRDLIENHLMGYAMRTCRYRLVVWKDRRHQEAPPLFVELFDHQNDSAETQNIAVKYPYLGDELLRQFDKG